MTTEKQYQQSRIEHNLEKLQHLFANTNGLKFKSETVSKDCFATRVYVSADGEKLVILKYDRQLEQVVERAERVKVEKTRKGGGELIETWNVYDQQFGRSARVVSVLIKKDGTKQVTSGMVRGASTPTTVPSHFLGLLNAVGQRNFR